MAYYFVRYMPKPGEVFPGTGPYHPALIARCTENPVGVDARRFDDLVPDPFERALVLTTGIIIEYEEPSRGIYSEEALRGGYIRKAWRSKKGKWFHTAVQRGHRLKVKE
jgi:hypothetical protein